MKSAIPINYVNGDATRPLVDGQAIIAHICNDIGGWGAGFVRAISKRWKEPEKQYRLWFNGVLKPGPPFALGQVLFVKTCEGVLVANMIGQQGVGRCANPPPIRYEAMNEALGIVASEALRIGASVHMPRIGCGLAGGSWELIEPLIQSNLADRGVAVTVYDFAT
jgi:O-acetyl-ADP-ribose deacetylase (regulator of RNase III)